MHVNHSMDTKHLHIPPLSSVACEEYRILFRNYVSRKSAGKGRAVLEGIGLPQEIIDACYVSYPRNEEEAVQTGLNKWVEDHHGYCCTWKVLLSAMEHAGIAQQHCLELRENLSQKLTGVCVHVCVCVCVCVSVCVCVCMCVVVCACVVCVCVCVCVCA